MPHWNGGDCPCDPETIVQFAIRVSPKARASEYPTARAGGLRWSHDGGAGDIVFYKEVGR